MNLVFMTILGLALVHGAPMFPREKVRLVLASTAADIDALQLCDQLGLNTFVKILKELNLTQKLETHDPYGQFALSDLITVTVTNITLTSKMGGNTFCSSQCPSQRSKMPELKEK